ncbi:MAG TPA: glycosyltransferase [Acidimicrobiales bacterium]|nr:glycosyltransferase [Acidimicrobiales bacterium]
MGDHPVRVSVILPVRNGQPFLEGQLEALERQSCSFPWEVIVVDNGSTDGSYEMAAGFADRLPKFQLLRVETPGKSRALNRGIEVAQGEHLVFVDADDEAGEGYVEKMSRALGEFDVVGAYIDTDSLNPWCARKELAANDGMPVYHRFREALPGCVVAMRATVCASVGPFDVSLISAEDIDYCWRAVAAGATLGRQLDAVMLVRRPADSRAAFKKARGYGHSAVWLYERYRSEGMPRRTLRNVVAPMRWAITNAIRGDGPWGWAIAWELGTLVGRGEESVRRRVYFP